MAHSLFPARRCDRNRHDPTSVFLQIKRVSKLNDNDTSSKKGQPAYDPTYKYKLVPGTVVSNTNANVGVRGLGLRWRRDHVFRAGLREAGSGVIPEIAGKPGLTSGGQGVILVDRDRVRARAFYPRHKLQPKRDGVGAQGPNEVLGMLAKVRPMIIGGNQVTGVRQILTRPPFTCRGNHFPGDDLYTHEDVGDTFPIMGTVRRDRLPREVASRYMHKLKTQPGNKIAKAARVGLSPRS